MKYIITACILSVFFCMPAQAEDLQYDPYEFFDLRFGMTMEEAGELLWENYGIECEAIQEDAAKIIRDKITLLIPAESPCIRYGGYLFMPSFMFVSDALSAVHLYLTDMPYVSSSYVWTPQDLFLHRNQIASQYADLLRRLEAQYGEPTQQRIVSLGETSADQWLFPSDSNLDQCILFILENEDYVTFTAKFHTIYCCLMQTHSPSMQDMPFCIIWIAYMKDGSYENLPLMLQKNEELSEAYFTSSPDKLYPIPQEIERRMLTKEKITIAPLQYVNNP